MILIIINDCSLSPALPAKGKEEDGVASPTLQIFDNLITKKLFYIGVFICR
jgi:hypothetical protein